MGVNPVIGRSVDVVNDWLKMSRTSGRLRPAHARVQKAERAGPKARPFQEALVRSFLVYQTPPVGHAPVLAVVHVRAMPLAVLVMMNLFADFEVAVTT